MRSWSRKFFLEILHVVHKCATLGLSGRKTWSWMLIFEMGFILSRGGHLRQLLSNEVVHSLTARIALSLALILLYKSLLFVNCRARSRLSLIKVSFSELGTYFASRIAQGSKIGSWGGHVVVRCGSLLSFGEIVPGWAANEDSMFVDKISFGIVVGGSRFVGIVIDGNLFGRLAPVTESIDRWLV